MSAISGFCEKCNKYRKRYCDGNRNTCMSILFDTIEALQQENEQLLARVARVREVLRKAREALVECIDECIDALELCTHNELCKIAVLPYDMIRDAKEALAEIDKAIGGKEDVTSTED